MPQHGPSLGTKRLPVCWEPTWILNSSDSISVEGLDLSRGRDSWEIPTHKQASRR